jgi:hypothetical protein
LKIVKNLLQNSATQVQALVSLSLMALFWIKKVNHLLALGLKHGVWETGLAMRVVQVAPLSTLYASLVILEQVKSRLECKATQCQTTAFVPIKFQMCLSMEQEIMKLPEILKCAGE